MHHLYDTWSDFETTEKKMRKRNLVVLSSIFGSQSQKKYRHKRDPKQTLCFLVKTWAIILMILLMSCFIALPYLEHYYVLIGACVIMSIIGPAFGYFCRIMVEKSSYRFGKQRIRSLYEHRFIRLPQEIGGALWTILNQDKKRISRRRIPAKERSSLWQYALAQFFS